MNMKLRYRGGFYSVSNTLYDIEIWQDEYAGTVQEIAFCAPPLDLEWPETDKLEPVQSSRATLQLYSDSDRQFIDLYTIKAGSIRMDVYRNKVLYWSGTLDPELYEEPFAYLSDYGVTLTFADMAILDRLNWNRTGFMTLREIIMETLAQTVINYKSLQEYISTKLSQYSSDNILDAISVNLANFFDEDGEPMTMREVLDETLRPYGLRLIQKEGKIVLYDLNDIYTELNPEAINWVSDDSVLSIDKVYNNVKLTFSPYEKTTLLKGVVDKDSITGGRQLTTWVDGGSANDEKGFTTRLSDTGIGLEKSSKAKYFHIEPIYSGQDEAGIAWTVQTFSSRGSGNYVSYVQPATSNTGEMLLKVPETPYLTYIGYNRNKYKLKVNLSLLFDVRYNPFEEAQINNEEGNWDRLKNWCNFAYVPFILTLRDASGSAIYHWENKEVKNSNSFARNCRWVAGEGKWGDAWLCWYQGNRKNETGLGGWQSNKQIIGYYRGDKLPFLFDKMDQGEYIDMPDKPGYIELQIGVGVPCYDYGKNGWTLRDDINERIRWALYKEPEIKVVDKNGKSLDNKDVEHTAWINRSAKEELKIDTILGTLKEASPAAQGQLFLTSDKSVKNSFYRAEVTDQLERLLIGTIYSNYATRHNTLAGTVALLPSFGIYTDTNEPGKYLLLSETQHLKEDESEILMVQFDADNYKGVEFDE